MPKISCLVCPHEIFYSSQGGSLKCSKCSTNYTWNGPKIEFNEDEVAHQQSESQKKIELAKETGDFTSLTAFEIQSIAGDIVLTTGLSVAKREIEAELEVISAECVYGMHFFKDVFAGVRDIVGGRSKAVQETLRDARRTALAELRREALIINADAVIGISLDYHELSGGGKGGMIMLVASGTAVKLK